MEINVLIDEDLEGYLEESWLRNVAEQVLVTQHSGSRMELGLVITSQERVRQLNLSYLGKDEPTDVLAFSAVEEIEGNFPAFVMPPDGVSHLGEVIISYPQAVVQAEEQRHSLKREIALLIIHGVLHLLGYDHDKAESKRCMSTKENEILGHLEQDGL